MREDTTSTVSDQPVQADGDIHFAREGVIGRITLDRPRALNALTLGMLEALEAQLLAWAKDPQIRVVTIQSGTDRAFCAGGDVRGVWEAGGGRAGPNGFDPLAVPDDALPRRIFFQEYRTNLLIARYPKPYIAFIDGLAMGGGLGISVHGSHRVVTERAVLAMPETSIGLFPDVGATVFLNACPGLIGLWLGMTGARIDQPSDMLYTGLATDYVPAAGLPGLWEAMQQAPWTKDGEENKDLASALIGAHCECAGPATLPALRPFIDRCFGAASVGLVLRALEAEGSAWAQETLALLAQRSPTSLCLTFRQLTEGRDLDLDSALEREFRMMQRCMAAPDFYEGIRATLVDKDNRPVWQPSRLDEVSPTGINPYFAPLPRRELRTG